jgi:hypothetical protein
VTHQWMFQFETDDHDEAIEYGEDFVKQHKGTCRVVVQHVIARA